MSLSDRPDQPDQASTVSGPSNSSPSLPARREPPQPPYLRMEVRHAQDSAGRFWVVEVWHVRKPPDPDVDVNPWGEVREVHVVSCTAHNPSVALDNALEHVKRRHLDHLPVQTVQL